MASTIMMPAYSKLQDDRPALQRAYLRTLSLVMFVVLPASAGLVLAAEPLLVVVYGEKWLPAVLPLQILAVFGLMRALAAFSGYMFEGIGLPKIAFQLGLMRLAVIAPLIVPVTKEFGLRGAAITVTAGMAVQWVAGLAYVRRFLGVSVLRSLAACWRAAWTTALMAVAVFGLMHMIPYNTWWGFAVVTLVGVAAYGLLNVGFLKRLKGERFT